MRLYNIAKDLQEKNDLAESQPARVKEMLVRLVDWEKEMGVEEYSGVQ